MRNHGICKGAFVNAFAGHAFHADPFKFPQSPSSRPMAIQPCKKPMQEQGKRGCNIVYYLPTIIFFSSFHGASFQEKLIITFFQVT
jgi:hypothetical protein